MLRSEALNNHVLCRFKVIISYTCEFCGQEKNILHYIYSMKDLEFYINRKIEIIIEICTFYTENVRLNGKEQHIIHLHILLGKLNIHKKKWAQYRPNIHFINDFKLYVNLVKKIIN